METHEERLERKLNETFVCTICGLYNEMHDAEKTTEAGIECVSCHTKFMGYTKSELHIVFQMVRDPENWKNPIKAYINRAYAEKADAAVGFFTGGPATISSVPGCPDMIEVTAPGYYLSCGP